MTHRTLNGLSFETGRWLLQADRSTILFIHGSGSNRSFWANQLDALTDCCEGIAGSKNVHIPRAGHISPVEQPDAVNRAIRELLGATPER